MLFFKRKKEAAREFYNSGELFRPILEIAQFGALDDKERAQTNLPDFLTKELPLIADRLVEGHTRCAFCEETREDLSGYHFRPPYNSEPMENREDREYYFWLSLSEKNIFPICPQCRPTDPGYFPMRRGKRARPWPEIFKVAEMALQMNDDSFGNGKSTSIWEGVTRLFFEGESIEQEILSLDNTSSKAVEELSTLQGFDVAKLASVSEYSTRKAEAPLLYEPGQVYDPTKRFAVSIDGEFSAIESYVFGSPQPPQSRAGETIRHFNLNNPQTLERRRAVLSNRLDQLFEAARMAEPDLVPDLFDVKTMDFGSAWYLLLRRIGVAWQEQANLRSVLNGMSVSLLSRTFRGLIRSNTFGVLEDVVDGVRRSTEEDSFLRGDSDIAEVTRMKDVRQQVARRVRPKLNTAEGAKITSVEIRNFKALENLTIALPQPPANTDKTGAALAVPAIIVLGENASGKSTILEAISAATVDSEAFKALKLDINKLVLNPRYMGLRYGAAGMEDRVCEITVTLETGKAYRTRFSRSEPVTREIRDNGEDWRPIGPEDGLNVFAYGAHRLFGAKTRNEGEAANVCTLFNNAKLLSDPEAWMTDLYDKDPEALDEIVAKLRNLISIDGEFRSIDVVPDPDNPAKRVCEIRVAKDLKVGDGQTQKYDVHMPLSAVSSGYRTIIALFCDIISGLLVEVPVDEVNEALIKEALSSPCTVMIDEIEAHLHPRWKMQVVEGLREVLPNAYFILTSHDPLCIRGMANEEVFVLNRDLNPDSQSEKDVLERVEFEPGNIKTELFTVEQLLTSNLFNLLTTEGHKREVFWARQIERGEGRDEIDQEVADALPIGDSVVTRLVQDAVWAYLKETRGQVHDQNARDEVIKKIKAELAKASF